MKAALYVALGAAAAVARVEAQAFEAVDKALWVDRHNYFRMSALPFAAGNMLRIRWSDELAAQAQADATACAAKSAAGVNAAVVAATGSPVDAAFQSWVVDAAMGVFPKLTAPKAAGDPVGAGNYNSYSQIVWSATNMVGCARAACGAKVGVACRYTAPGNDGTSPWYVHGAAGTACPAGLVSKVGLCVTSVDDPSYNDLAPIPAGQQSYEVFKDFIPNMQKALRGEAVAPAPAAPEAGAPAPAAPGAATPNQSTPAAATPAASAAAASAAPGAAPTSAAPAASAAPGAAPASATPGASAAPGASPTPAAPGASAAPSATTGKPATGGASPAPEPMVTKVVDGKVLVRVPKTTTPSSGSGASAPGASSPSAGTTPSTGPGQSTPTDTPMVTKIVDGKVLVRVPKTPAPAAGSGSKAGTATTPSVGDPTVPMVTKVVDGKVLVRVPKQSTNALSNDVVGTVKPSDNTGTSFANQVTTPGVAPAAGGSAAPAAAPAAAVAKPAAAVGANNKAGDAPAKTGFSAAGVAGVIVIGCVAVAGVAVFMSYRKNQKRQRDIMQNGGIHVL